MGAIRWALVVIGVAAILGALAWTLITRQRRLDDLIVRLHDVDARVRARAGVTLIEDGSRRAAKELQSHLVTEPDPRARLAIALAVAARAERGSPVDFQHWAASELAGASVAAARPAPEPVPAVAYAMADAGAPADRAISWHLVPDA